MISLMTTTKARKTLAESVQRRRIDLGLTQKGMAERSGVCLATLRKFEQQAVISLESFLKILMVLGALENIVEALKPDISESFKSIDDVIQAAKKLEKKPRQRGWKA